MRTEGIKVKVTIPIPIGRPDKNGVVYTEKAIEKAVGNLCENLPIVYRDNENNADGSIFGTVTTTSYVEDWNFKNRVCNITVDGIVFFGGTECVVNEIKDGKVTEFEIVGIGLSK